MLSDKTILVLVAKSQAHAYTKTHTKQLGNYVASYFVVKFFNLQTHQNVQ